MIKILLSRPITIKTSPKTFDEILPNLLLSLPNELFRQFFDHAHLPCFFFVLYYTRYSLVIFDKGDEVIWSQLCTLVVVARKAESFSDLLDLLIIWLIEKTIWESLQYRVEKNYITMTLWIRAEAA